MQRSLMRYLVVCLALLSLTPAAAAQDARPVLVFAAASLQTALKAVAETWKIETGKSVTFSFAASSALARQLENGAPADIFASADLDWMDWSETRNLIKPETRQTLLGNRLVLITSRDTPLELKIGPAFGLAAALANSRLATGDVKSVPAGRYAQAALTSLGVWESVKDRIAGAESVRAALVLVARGEAKLGIVYATDARAEPNVRVVDTFPDTSHPPIMYPFAVTATSVHPDAARFLAFLSSPKARAIFEAEGFQVLKR